MRQLLCYVLAASLAFLAWGADTTTTAKKKTVPKKKTAASTQKSGSKSGSTAHKSTPSAARKTTTTASNSKKGTTSKKAPVKKAASWRSRQLSPTPQRYQEIQSALVAKGYLKSEDANGTWNENSVDALKKFQTEQNLEANGKINSLSLIALGLGPKHDIPAKPAENPQ